jgi:hypothetical protein
MQQIRLRAFLRARKGGPDISKFSREMIIMPTYKRIAETPATTVLTDGGIKEVLPGETVETYKVLGAGWQKTSAEPYYNPVLALDSFNLPIAGTAPVTVMPGTRTVIISGITGGPVTPYIDSTDNHPPLHSDLAEGDVLTVEVDGNIGTLQLVFANAGTAMVKQQGE